MARMSAAERAELEARLAADDDAGDDDPVEISHDGKTFKGSFRRARGVARAWGLKLEADPDPDPGPDDDGPGKAVRFGRRVS
jgi:hypothetical protein